MFSLREDFSTAFHRLVHTPAGTQIGIDLDDRYFPVLLRGRNVQVDVARVVLQVPSGASVADFEIDVDGVTVANFAPDAALAGERVQDLPAAFRNQLRGPHTFLVRAPGDLAGAATTVDPRLLEDVVLYVTYRIV